ncbi:tail fiber domain-containing protein [Dokdonella sp.]|jgi:hypothetical protein|uniref:tail fiber domain-containing protein n=1 Tax=Dokdonella sp. TaxID=2291710 RepID=UPI003783B345
MSIALRALSGALLAACPFVAFAAAPDGADGRAAGARAATVPAAVPVPKATARTDAGSSPQPNDQVIADDLIVQSSLCVGFDCVLDEDFGFDTLRLKENNTRIVFFDTSTGTFPADHWQLTANDTASGGLNRFSIENLTALTIPFTVLGHAPTDSLVVSAVGDVGIGTAAPAFDVHVQRTDTPGMRLDQTNAGGFTAQTWDVAGNEAGFFVRDVTGGSLLPFRIRPGAPTSSLYVAASGDVGIGTGSPAAKLDVNGDMLVHGTIAQLSSRTAKEHFVPVDGKGVLAKLEAMPISSWNYLGAGADDRHLGPVAEDFHAAFGLGTSDHFVAPTDLAGVALASVKALQDEVRERDQRIDTLEARLRELEDIVRHGRR